MDTLIFHHIPKTAGRTFYEILERQYKDYPVFRTEPGNELESVKKFKTLPKNKREEYKLIYGHLALSLKDFVSPDVKVCTFIRNPLKQVISSYLHIRRTPYNQFHKIVKNMDNIIEYIEWLPSVQFDNLQTRHLSEAYFYLQNNNPNKGILDKKHFDLAKNQITNIDYVLLTEHFEESLFHLKKELNWKYHLYYKYANVSKEKIDIDINTIEDKLKTINFYDNKIYELAKSKFHANVALKKRSFIENYFNRAYNIFG